MTVSERASQVWIVSIKPENWEVVAGQQLFAFPREDNTRKVLRGDRLVAYVPGTYSIRGVFEIVSEWSRSSTPRYPDEIREGTVLYPFEARIRTIVTGIADLGKIKKDLVFIKDKNNIGIYFQRNPGNHEQPISTSDYNLILEELRRNPQPMTPLAVGEKTKTKVTRPERGTDTLGHFEARDMLVELGKLKGMEESMAEYSFDNFKLDVVWKRSMVRAYPDYAFEVHVGGDLWKDLASLKHAYDRFGCQVVLVGQPEDKTIVEQQLPGTFHEMSRHFRFVEISGVVKLHALLKQTKDLEHSLGL